MGHTTSLTPTPEGQTGEQVAAGRSERVRETAREEQRVFCVPGKGAGQPLRGVAFRDRLQCFLAIEYGFLPKWGPRFQRGTSGTSPYSQLVFQPHKFARRKMNRCKK